MVEDRFFQARKIERTFSDAIRDARSRQDYKRVHHLACTAIAALQELGVKAEQFEKFKEHAEFVITFDEVSL